MALQEPARSKLTTPDHPIGQWQRRRSESYFFLKPGGHLGFIDITFLVSLPLTQVMVDFFIAAALSEAALSDAIFCSAKILLDIGTPNGIVLRIVATETL
jgi:hypothetical protein